MSSAQVSFLAVSGSRNTIADTYRFQCAPLEEFSYESSHDFTDYLTVSGGEFDRRYGRKLRTLSFDTLVADDNPSWVSTGINKTADNLVAELLAICDAGSTFEMDISSATPTAATLGTQHDDGTLLRMTATLRNVRVTEKAGEPGTKYLTLQCTEHRQPVLTTSTRPGTSPKAQKHTLTMQYNREKKKWKITVSPKGSSISKDIAHAVKIHRVTLGRLALAAYGKTYQSRIADVLKANKGLGAKWGKDTPLEKNQMFKSGKKRTITLPK